MKQLAKYACFWYPMKTMAKEMTIEDLAVIIQKTMASKEDIHSLNLRFDGVEKRLDRIENKVDGHEQRITKLEDGVKDVRGLLAA